MNYKIVKVILIILLIAYIVITPNSEFIADIISPVYFISVGVLILHLAEKSNDYRKFYQLLALAPLIWGVIDLLWFITNTFTSYDPENSSLITLLYLLPNAILLLAAFLYFMKNVAYWNRNQLILDILVVSTLILGLSSALYFSNVDFQSFTRLELVGLILYVATDVLSLMILLVMASSSRLNKLSGSILFVAAGYLIYILADLIYIDTEINGLYQANSITDVMFMVSFLFIAMAALLRSQNPKPDKYSNEEPMNLGKSYITWYLTLPILLLFFFGRISMPHMAVFLFVILMYQVLSFYIQKSLVSEILYIKELEYKHALEDLVAERTEDLRISRDALKHKTITDSLTSLFNRDYFYETVNEKIRKKQEFSIFYLDLNRFKVINDLHGHNMGDTVLKKIAKRLANHLSITTDIFRFGGDEFAVIIQNVKSDYIDFTAREIVDVINQNILIDDYSFSVGVSLGISRFPQDGESANELMKHADIAMYHAKHHHSDQHVVFSTHMVDKIERRNKIELLLKAANFDKEFDLHYQPQFDTFTKELHGMEALIRWNHPDEGFISPGEFIPIAEEIGMIKVISDWVLEKSMKQIMIWNDIYKKEYVMGINISPISLNSISFFPGLKQLISKLGINPAYIDFEITEHSAMNTATLMEEIFTALSGLGIQISIDDFGTGYSSLSYIKRFDVDTLKIAKELIDNITEDYNDHLIVKAIIMMANGLGLKTIAEGVETEDQYELLKTIGCHRIQGYYLGRPVNTQEFEKSYLK
jgi:diguanylate cyclase (GGDEF)-like protein